MRHLRMAKIRSSLLYGSDPLRCWFPVCIQPAFDRRGWEFKPVEYWRQRRPQGFFESRPIGDVDQDQHLGRVVGRVLEIPDGAHPHRDRLFGRKGPAHGAHAEVAAFNGAGLVIPDDPAELPCRGPCRV